ncbi:MAG TPA: nicotinate-nucleotide adenylyltransferase [Clostridia bacterium]|nr:nicotinate-nucleotide adenylyltransferase [Clostridia bacterium]
MGGTFDPIHNGHLFAAEAVRQGFGLDVVIFIPAARPPHKNASEVSDPETRYVMVELATADNPYFVVSRIELDRPGPSHTVDTIAALKENTGPDTDIYFITGADAMQDLYKWKDHDTLLLLCKIVAVARPGYSLKVTESLRSHLGDALWARIYPFEVPALAISSSEIRERVRTGKSIKYLVPPTVEHYIRKVGLYVK